MSSKNYYSSGKSPYRAYDISLDERINDMCTKLMGATFEEFGELVLDEKVQNANIGDRTFLSLMQELGYSLKSVSSKFSTYEGDLLERTQKDSYDLILMSYKSDKTLRDLTVYSVKKEDKRCLKHLVKKNAFFSENVTDVGVVKEFARHLTYPLFSAAGCYIATDNPICLVVGVLVGLGEFMNSFKKSTGQKKFDFFSFPQDDKRFLKKHLGGVSKLRYALINEEMSVRVRKTLVEIVSKSE